MCRCGSCNNFSRLWRIQGTHIDGRIVYKARSKALINGVQYSIILFTHSIPPPLCPAIVLDTRTCGSVVHHERLPHLLIHTLFSGDPMFSLLSHFLFSCSSPVFSKFFLQCRERFIFVPKLFFFFSFEVCFRS